MRLILLQEGMGRSSGLRRGIKISWDWNLRLWVRSVSFNRFYVFLSFPFRVLVLSLLIHVCYADGLLAFSIVALSVLVPAQTSAVKQRVGVYLWLGMLVIVFSLLMKLFKMKNGGYPFSLLF